LSRRTAVLVLAVAALLASGSTAQAQTKPYSVVLAPATTFADAARPITVTVTNLTKTQELGSMDLTVPPARAPSVVRPFVVTNVTPPTQGTATTDGIVVRLRNAALLPGGRLSFTMTVDTRNAPLGFYVWTVRAKQSNDFNGTGNDLDLAAASSVLQTRIIPPPSASVDCAEDARGAVGTCQTEIGLEAETGLPATRPRLTTLKATATAASKDNDGVLSGRFPAVLLDCPGLAEQSPVTGDIVGPPNRSNRVIYRLEGAPTIGGTPPGICFAAPKESAINPAFPVPGAPFVFEGVSYFVSVLPNCTKAIRERSACVESSRYDNGVHEYVVFTPDLYTDPMYRG
jgi:hypothetical protein